MSLRGQYESNRDNRDKVIDCLARTAQNSRAQGDACETGNRLPSPRDKLSLFVPEKFASGFAAPQTTVSVWVARPESSKGVVKPTPFEDSGRATRRRRVRHALLASCATAAKTRIPFTV